MHPENKADFSNEELIGYMLIHSETPRALFSNAHVARILKLAGYDLLSAHYECGPLRKGFTRIDQDQAKHLAELYRARKDAGVVINQMRQEP
jgi:hypothetical protein